MRFLIAADIVYQLMSTTLAVRAGCARIEQRAQSEELRKAPENNYSTHMSAARERTNIHTTECIYPKDQAPKHTTGGLSQKWVEVTPNGPPGPALHC